jgi:hypothetical protein
VDESARTFVTELSAVVDAWDEAWTTTEVARRHRDVGLARAAAAVDVALAGMSLRRWRTLVDGRVVIRSRADGRAINLARQRRKNVQLCLKELDTVRTIEEAKVQAAERDLAGATRRLLVYGPLAERVTAQPNTYLRRMALQSDGRRTGRDPQRTS